jgi:hypothetical protein
VAGGVLDDNETTTKIGGAVMGVSGAIGITGSVLLGVGLRKRKRLAPPSTAFLDGLAISLFQASNPTPTFIAAHHAGTLSFPIMPAGVSLSGNF